MHARIIIADLVVSISTRVYSAAECSVPNRTAAYSEKFAGDSGASRALGARSGRGARPYLPIHCKNVNAKPKPLFRAPDG
jgi:hypothetical protein